MEEGQVPQGERSDGWERVRAGRSNGWPLGLHPLNARLSIASSSTFLISSPSLSSSSSSSSDFDTESTGSFFPEKSTTLGSLIGIHSSSQIALEQISSIEEEKTTRKSTGGNSRSRAWWALLGCGRSLQDDPLDISPSLAHFLGKERGATLSQRQTIGNNIGEHHTHEEQEQDEQFHSDEIVLHRNGSYDEDDEGAITSRPCGPPTLRLILQQPSPTSYPSTDWNVFSDLPHHHHIRGDSTPAHRRCHSFWPGLCGRLSTCTAN